MFPPPVDEQDFTEMIDCIEEAKVVHKGTNVVDLQSFCANARPLPPRVREAPTPPQVAKGLCCMNVVADIPTCLRFGQNSLPRCDQVGNVFAMSM